MNDATKSVPVKAPLLPSIHRAVAGEPLLEPDSKEFRGLRQSVIAQHKHTCAFCGLRSKKHLQVHHVDLDHNNLDANNLVPACPLCHRVFHLEYIAFHCEQAKIIYLPEMTQAELNSLSYACFAWMAEGEEKAETARKLLAGLIHRENVATEYLHTLDHNPRRLAGFLAEISDRQFKSRNKFLKHIRVLFSRPEIISKEMVNFKKDVFALTPASTLKTISRKYLPKGPIQSLPARKHIPI